MAPPPREQFSSTPRSQSTPVISVTSNPRLPRSYSEKEARGSEKLLSAIEFNSVSDVRSLLTNVREAEKSILTAPSLMAEHFQRTPFMAAAERGDLSIFTALLHFFNRLFSDSEQLNCWAIGDAEDCPQHQRDGEMRTQLAMQDTNGMTVAMLAARNGNVSILSAILAEIQHTKTKRPLETSDFRGNTLILHAASVGSTPVFQAVFQAMEAAFRNDVGGVGPHLTRQSGDGRTVLMWAARAGDPLALRAVVEAVRRSCDPQTVRHLLYQRDADGMNFLMHSAVCSMCPPVPVKDSDNLGISASGIGFPANYEREPQLKRETSTGSSSLALSDVEAQPPDPSVPVFNIATEMVKKCLWKEQLREHLTAKDISGRSLFAHAIRSGRCQLFDSTLRAVREDVLDTEIEEMLETADDELDRTPIRSALVDGGRKMQKKFQKRRRQLKKDTSRKAKLSTIEAKIQSFIPGKLIVIFQLLLPVITRNHQLYLLLVMCFLAPFFNWANALLLQEKPAAENPATAPSAFCAPSIGWTAMCCGIRQHHSVSREGRPERRETFGRRFLERRTSKVSFLLGAPALFFWGIGTSDIGLTFEWSATRSAAALAVATIIIPAIDAFFNSKSVQLWYEQWSCQKKRFVDRANREWRHRSRKPLERGYEMISMRHHEIDHILRHSAASVPLVRTSLATPTRSGTGQPLPPHAESAEDET
ncbi:unnamed protein product [Scytosiphon promiscuus]